MARRRFVQIDGELVEVGDDYVREPIAPMIYGDIQPYRSAIDGSLIGSRSTHREHLKAHGCIEVGNEKMTSKRLAPPPGLKETIARVVNEKWRR